MKLGQKVKFNKSLSRQSGYGVSYDHMSDEEEKQLEENAYIKIVRWKEREHNHKHGLICGKRHIVTAAVLEEVEDPYKGWHLAQTDYTSETVYVVACDMQRLYRVREEDLVVIGND